MWIIALAIVIGGIWLLVDASDPPISKCTQDQVGCADMRYAFGANVIEGFEESEGEPGSLATWEINDDDRFLVVYKGNRFRVEYPLRKRAEARALRDFILARRQGLNRGGN